MPIAIRTASTLTNRSVSFAFDSDVLMYVVGISHWKFRFGGSDDHHIKSLELSVRSNKSSREVVSTVSARLQDDCGHDIDNGNSSVNLVCLAVTVAPDTNIVMATVDNVAHPGTSGNIALPSASLGIAQSFLEGFRVAHATSDHHMKQVQFIAGLETNGNIGQIAAFAQMSDGSGHVATGSVDGSLVAATLAQSGLLAQSLLDRQTSGAITVGFGRPIVAGAALLQSYCAAFSGDDHHVREIGGGASKCAVQGGKLVLTDARAFMSDGSGNRQSDGASRVSMVAFGIPG